MPHLHLHHQGGDAEEGQANPSFAGKGFERIHLQPTDKVGVSSDQSEQEESKLGVSC